MHLTRGRIREKSVRPAGRSVPGLVPSVQNRAGGIVVYRPPKTHTSPFVSFMRIHRNSLIHVVYFKPSHYRFSIWIFTRRCRLLTTTNTRFKISQNWTKKNVISGDCSQYKRSFFLYILNSIYVLNVFVTENAEIY